MFKRYKKAPQISKKNLADGFTIIEVIFAMSILAVGLLAVATMQITAIRGNDFSMDVTTGIDLVQDRVDKLLEVNIGHADLTAGHHDDPITGDRYDISWDVINSAPPITGVKIITVTAEWNDRGTIKRHTFEFMRTEI